MTASTIDTVLLDLYDTLVCNDWSTQADMIAGRLDVTPGTVKAVHDDLRSERDGGGFADARSVMTAVVSACGVEPRPELVDELLAAEKDLLATGVHWYDDSVPFLRRLRVDGYTTGVISNCSASTRPVVERLGLESETDAIVLSFEVGSAKPAPEIFHAALEAVGGEAPRAMFVDDRADYLDGAAALGMRTVRIARPVAFGEDSTGGGHPVVTTLEELRGLL